MRSARMQQIQQNTRSANRVSVDVAHHRTIARSGRCLADRLVRCLHKLKPHTEQWANHRPYPVDANWRVSIDSHRRCGERCAGFFFAGGQSWRHLTYPAENAIHHRSWRPRIAPHGGQVNHQSGRDECACCDTWSPDIRAVQSAYDLRGDG